jgi:hypothetical protein
MFRSRRLGFRTSADGQGDAWLRAKQVVGYDGVWVTVGALGFTQILAWGATYYLLAALADPIVVDTCWPMPWVIVGLSLGLERPPFRPDRWHSVRA